MIGKTCELPPLTGALNPDTQNLADRYTCMGDPANSLGSTCREEPSRGRAASYEKFHDNLLLAFSHPAFRDFIDGEPMGFSPEPYRPRRKIIGEMFHSNVSLPVLLFQLFQSPFD
jgi:hypothetical protein